MTTLPPSGPDGYQRSLALRGGACGTLIAEKDWSGTLGDIGGWPPSLRVALDVALASPVAMAILWGPDGVLLYNDAYSAIAGERHPRALGRRVRDAWPEAAEFNGEVLRRVLGGGTLTYKEVEIPLWRRGRLEPVWFDLAYSPIADEGGEPGGVLAVVTETTASVLAARQRAAEHRRLVGMFEQAPGLIAILEGPRHVFALANAAFRDLVGGREVVGLPVVEALPELAAQGFVTLLDEVLRTGEPYRAEAAEVWLDQGDGRAPEQRFVSFIYQPIADEGGRVGGIFVEGFDVTERVTVQDAVRASEASLRAQAEELRAVLDAVPAGIWITHDAEAREIQGNARSHELLRVPEGVNQSASAPDAPTRHFRFLDDGGRELAPRDLPVQAAARGETVADREFRVVFDDGTHVDLFGNATPLRDAQGRVSGAVAAFVDITGRKAAEAALREETRRLETLNRAGAALTAELDPEALVQRLTDAGVALTGARFGAYFHNLLDESGERLHLYTLSGADRADFEGLGGVRATGVFGPTFRNRAIVRSDDVLADPRYGHLGPHHGMPPGHLPVRSYLGVPVVSRSGAVLGGLLFGHPDRGRFTERHERLMTALAAQAAVALDNANLLRAAQRANESLEARVAQALAEREKAEEALRQSQKMEAIGQLTGGIAHDFNNLLTPILGGLDILRRRAEDERSQRLIGAALQAAERGKTLVSRLLAFARRQTLQPRPTDLGALIDGLRELIDRSLGPAIEVRVDVAPDLPAVLIDPNQLELALLNLAVNARDAMPGGGVLALSARARTAPDPSAPDLSAGRYVRLAVSDTGTGMDEATLARAVEPFFSTKGIGKGTGLGLSMVHGLMAQLGGAFRLESRPGHGTEASLWLPVAPVAARAGGGPEEPAPDAPRAAVVLVVDDEPIVRVTVAEELRELGYEVVEAASAAEALEALRTGVRPDIVVTDHMMPGMTGLQLAAALRERVPGLPVVLATGYANLAPQETRGLKVLAKPFRLGDLATMIAQALGQDAR